MKSDCNNPLRSDAERRQMMGSSPPEYVDVVENGRRSGGPGHAGEGASPVLLNHQRDSPTVQSSRAMSTLMKLVGRDAPKVVTIAFD